MAHLFSKSAIKQATTLYQWFDLSREIAIVQELYQDFCKGNMADETRYEQRFNNLFFGQLLGYEENIHRHPKASTPVGSKIADVWLGFFVDGLYSYEGVKVVVELKGATTLLDKKQASYGGQSPVDQWFGYKTSYQDCPRLIVSNFASVRLYRDNKQDFEVWTIEDLVNPDNNYYHLQTLLGLLKRNHLIAPTGSSVTEKLLSEVRVQQEQITKKFYKEYKDLRFELINDIRQHNPDLHVELIVEKAQKIIDRIIFIHFCEDKGLLPADKLKTNLLRGHELDLTPREVIKIYCRGVDKGSEKLDIPNGYNGGLFHEDSVLNDLAVGNAICMKFIDLGNYDFDDELSVNILGHIFEQSISDIEQLKGELIESTVIARNEAIHTPWTTQDVDRHATLAMTEKKESKRKKDGIFYTPEYIVDYIVQNSLMKYLEEQEAECLVKIGKKWWYKTEIEAYQAYQHILQHIKVLDPACGSGAFLVKVFDYLYAENKRVGEIVGGLFTTDEIYKSILRNNIYGVDLNPESVEITKLSLWLKSAQKGKKLNNLDANIKCGNSLIDDPAVAGDRAFDRKNEFADIMKNGGFDVIVGNPPYVTNRLGKKQEWSEDIEIQYYKKIYWDILEYKWNLYSLFIAHQYNILKINWRFSFIVPNTFLLNKTYKNIRDFIINNFDILEINNLKYEPFDEATIGWCCIFVFSKWNKTNDTSINEIYGKDFFLQNANKNIINYKKIKGDLFWNFYTNINGIKIIDKIYNSLKINLLWDIVDFYQGIITWDNKRFIASTPLSNKYKKIIKWENISRYNLWFSNNYVLFEPELLRSNTDSRKFETTEKLINRQTSDSLVVCYDDKQTYSLDSTHIQNIKQKDISIKYLLVLENSSLINFIYKFLVDEWWKTFAQVKTINLKDSQSKASHFPNNNLSSIRLISCFRSIKSFTTRPTLSWDISRVNFD
jgi:hypothetical protein